MTHPFRISGYTFGLGIGLQGLVLFILYLAGIVGAMLAALVLRRTVTKGAASGFIMEMPKYQWPPLRDLALGLWQLPDKGTGWHSNLGDGADGNFGVPDAAEIETRRSQYALRLSLQQDCCLPVPLVLLCSKADMSMAAR